MIGRIDAPRLAVVAATLIAALTTTASPALAAAERIQPPGATTATLDARWRSFVGTAGGAGDESAYLELRSTMRDLGLTELPAHALALVELADAAIASGDVDRARRLRDRAAALAPGSPLHHFIDARVAWETAPWNVAGYGAHLSAGYSATSETFDGHTALALAWRALTVSAVGIFSLLFIAAMAVRHGGRVAHDARIALRGSVSLDQARVVVAMLFIGSPLLLWSPAVFVLVVAALLMLHFEVGERVWVVLVLAGLAAVPQLANDSARHIAIGASPVRLSIAAVSGPCDERCDRRLQRLIDDHNDPHAALALAWVNYRRGAPDSRARARDLLDGVQLEGSARASAETLRGNLEFVDGDLGESARRYREAHRWATTPEQRAVASFNLYRVHGALGERQAAQSALAAATAESTSVVDAHIGHRGRSQNGVLATSGLPGGDLAKESVRSSRADELGSSDLSARWTGVLPDSAVAPLAVLVASLVLFGAWIERRRSIASRRCSACATPISRFIYAPAFESRLCVLCYPVQHLPHMLTEEQLASREERVEAWTSAAPAAGVIADVALPGFGSLVQGRTFIGAFACLLLSAAIAIGLWDSSRLFQYALRPDRLLDGRVQAAVALWAGAFALVIGARLLRAARR